MNPAIFPTAFVCLLLPQLSSLALAEESAGWDGNRADAHAPIGVIGDHSHRVGELMLSYRFMTMNMDGNRDGSSNLSDQQVLEDFMVTPTDMQMDMHMLGAMFAPSDRVTLMLMLPYLELEMNHLTRNGMRFTTRSSGLGDIGISGLTEVYESDSHKFILNTGLTLPSGEIDERDDTPAAEQAQLPYPMQLGSGTVDLKPGATYNGQAERLSWGMQGIGTIRLGRNDNDYSMGDRFDSTAWGAVSLSDWLSASMRTSWSVWGDYDGADPDLNPMMIPTADPDRRGGRQVDLAFGFNFLVPGGKFENLRIAVEGIFPVYQNLSGPQLETDWSYVAGAQYSF